MAPRKEREIISWEEYLNRGNIQSRAISIRVICIQCGTEDIIATRQFRKRIYKNQTCRKCALGFVVQNSNWRQNNSAAQYKIQSTPEQKKKNADGVSRFWREHPEVKKVVADKISKLYENREYRDKLYKSHRQCSALAGHYLWRNTWQYFGSSYELCFLVWTEAKPWIRSIRRPDFQIKYFYLNKIHEYIPDYLLLTTKNKKYLTEIKSIKMTFYEPDKDKAKINAAHRFVEENYLDGFLYISEEHVWAKHIQFKRSCGIKPLCKKLYSQGKIKLTSKEKQLRYIGQE